MIEQRRNIYTLYCSFRIEYNKKEVKQKLNAGGLNETKFIDIFKKDSESQPSPQKNQVEPAGNEDEEDIEFIEWEDEE